MVNKKSKWAKGSNQYKKKAKPISASLPQQTPSSIIPPQPETIQQQKQLTQIRQAACNVFWDSNNIDFSQMVHSNRERVLARFQASIPDHIWNTASLEGNNYTLPEVRTILDGVTVNGRTVEETEQILALKAGYEYVTQLVTNNSFSLTKEISDAVNARVANNEAIESGLFRGEGAVTGGGTVRLATGGTIEGKKHGKNGILLKEQYQKMSTYLNTLNDPRETATAYFASTARTQYYFDGNKRTARLMATGFLLTHGYDALNIEYARQLEYNKYLDHLFSTNDATPLMRFLATSSTNAQ